MIDNNNIVVLRDIQRFNQLDECAKKRVELLKEIPDYRYQLKVIKRKRPKLRRGDVFLVNPCTNIYLYGIVLNCNIDYPGYGKNLASICIFSIGTDLIESLEELPEFNKKNVLVGPELVSKSFWNNGLFYNIGNDEKQLSKFDYGYYKSNFITGKGKYVDDYGNEIFREPEMLSSEGLTSEKGIAYYLNYELIIDNSFLSLKNQKLYESFIKEILSMEESKEVELSDYEKEILPFVFYKEHSRRYSVILEDFEAFGDIFKCRSDELAGNGYDWEDLIKYFIKVNCPEERKKIKFDSESGMMYMYSSNELLIKNVLHDILKELKESDMKEYIMNAKFNDLCD